MDKSIAILLGHAMELAIAFNVVVVLDPRMSWMAGGAGIVDEVRPRTPIGAKAITIGPITDEASYAVALHELGHAIHPLGMLLTELRIPEPTSYSPLYEIRRFVNLKIQEEESAWEWARQYALYWTAAMEDTKKFGLDSYRQTFRNILGRR